MTEQVGAAMGLTLCGTLFGGRKNWRKFVRGSFLDGVHASTNIGGTKVDQTGECIAYCMFCPSECYLEYLVLNCVSTSMTFWR